MYYGQSKPDSVHDFLENFLSEIKEILECGLIIGKNDKKVSIEIRAFICDAPARAFLKGIKGHNSYFGCERCVVEGEYFHSVHHVSYNEFNCTLRKDDSFRNRIIRSTTTPARQLKICL